MAGPTSGSLASGTALAGKRKGLTDLFWAAQGDEALLVGDSDDSGRVDSGDCALRLAGPHQLIRQDLDDMRAAIVCTSGTDVLKGSNNLADVLIGSEGEDELDGGDDGNSIVSVWLSAS